MLTACFAAIVASCRAKPELTVVPHPLPAETLLRDVAVLDVVSGELRPGLDVLIRGAHIDRVSPTGAVRTGAHAVIIDSGGATLVPGLIDLHAHTGTSPAPAALSARPDPAANLRSYLFCGVTTVLDLGDIGAWAVDRRRAVGDGELLGPTLYVAGPVVTGHGAHPVGVLRLAVPFWLQWYAIPRYAFEVGTPAEAETAARDVAALGADFLKVVVDRIPPEAPRISNESLAAVVDAARQQGLRTVAHIGTTADALDAGHAGVAAWVHGVYRERIADEDIAALAAFGIPMVPTIEVFEAIARRGEVRQSTALERATVPAEVLSAFGTPPSDPELASFFARSTAALKEQRSNWRDNVRRLHAAGVTILAGSDMQSGVFPGPGLHRELENLRESGLSNVEVLRAATLNAARFLEGHDDPTFGQVAVGKRADLLLVDGDPREDLAHLTRIRAVIVRGIPVERRALSASR